MTNNAEDASPTIKNANMFFIGCQLNADKTSLETDKTRGLVESKALNSSFEV